MRWLQYQKAGSKKAGGCRGGGGEKMERMKERKGKVRDRAPKGRDLFSLEEGVALLHVGAKLS